MARKYEVPYEFLDAADRFGALAGELGADEAAACCRNEFGTMFRGNVKEIEPVHRAARPEKPQ